jgi:hypothetical protein
MYTAAAWLTIFRPVPGGIKLFPANGAAFDMLGDVFPVKQRHKPRVKRHYCAAVVFAQRRTGESHAVKHIALSLILSPMRGDTRGGSVFLLPGAVHSIRKEKV